MINNLEIRNFKSIKSLDLNFARINLFITSGARRVTNTPTFRLGMK